SRLSTVFFFSSRRRHTRFSRDWSSDVCSSDLLVEDTVLFEYGEHIFRVDTRPKVTVVAGAISIQVIERGREVCTLNIAVVSDLLCKIAHDIVEGRGFVERIEAVVIGHIQHAIENLRLGGEP